MTITSTELHCRCTIRGKKPLTLSLSKGTWFDKLTMHGLESPCAD